MPPTAADPSNDALTTQARDAVRRVPWQRLAVGAAGASALGLLGAAGLAPLLARTPAAAGELSSLLAAIDALPQRLDALQTEVAAQSDLLLAQYDLLQQVQADLNQLGQAGGALGPVLIQASTQVIAAPFERSLKVGI